MKLQDEIVNVFSTITSQAWLWNCSVLSFERTLARRPEFHPDLLPGTCLAMLSNASKLTQETSCSLHVPNGQSYSFRLIVMTYFLCVLHFE